MPPRRAWACWNFIEEEVGQGERPVYVSYFMNRLQGLETQREYFVTLNRTTSFRPDTVIAEMGYHHPMFTFESMATQAELPHLNLSSRKRLFCGSYFGFGFHEDAVKAGMSVASAFGMEL
jgi:predicted NAD/FAD-binding protein